MDCSKKYARMMPVSVESGQRVLLPRCPARAQPKREVYMNRKLATTALLIGALTLPALAFAEDKDQDRSSPKAWVKDSVITTKIKAEMVKDPAVSAAHIRVD